MRYTTEWVNNILHFNSYILTNLRSDMFAFIQRAERYVRLEEDSEDG